MSRKVFWPGFRWRVLAHKRTPKGGCLEGVSCRHCGWAGTDVFTHVDKRKARPWPLKCGGEWSRDLVYAHVVDMRSTDFGDRVEFDELVIDDWLHLEQMDERTWWMGIGNGEHYHAVWIDVDRDGKASVSIYHEPHLTEGDLAA